MNTVGAADTVAEVAPEIAEIREPVPDLLPLPASLAATPGVELAILWVRSLQGDRAARAEHSRVEEQNMLRAARERVENLRQQARDQWRSDALRAAGGIGAGALQVAGACCPTGSPEAQGSPSPGASPGERGAQVDTRAAVTGSGTLVEAHSELLGGFYQQRAGEHRAQAEVQQLAQEVANRHAARSRDAERDARDDVARTIELLSEMLAATQGAREAALMRG